MLACIYLCVFIYFFLHCLVLKVPFWSLKTSIPTPTTLFPTPYRREKTSHGSFTVVRCGLPACPITIGSLFHLDCPYEEWSSVITPSACVLHACPGSSLPEPMVSWKPGTRHRVHTPRWLLPPLSLHTAGKPLAAGINSSPAYSLIWSPQYVLTD